VDISAPDQNATVGERVQGALVRGQNKDKTFTRKLRLLIVDDDMVLAENLRNSLRNHGFLPTTTHSAKAAWETLGASTFDLVLLDVRLPEGDEAGFELAQRAREVGFRQPILFLSVRGTLSDRVRGLKYGDDYLTKPYELPELVARLEALSRRGPLPPTSIRSGDIELFRDGQQVYQNGVLVELTAREFLVLELFMLNPGRVFNRDEVLEHIWGMTHVAKSNTVDVHIKRIREKLDKKEIIEPVRGVGYRFRG
jgi:DNA-binding response OmpR family regulator